MSEQSGGESSPVQEQSSPEIQESQGQEAAQGEVSQEAQLQEVVETAIENGASEKQIQNMIKKYQLKVNGKTIEREVDLSNDDFIKNQLQLAEMSRIKMQESAELKKLYEKEVGRLKSNPWEVLQELGMDPDELAELRIQSRIEEMKKSPEQIEREKIQKELQEAREEAKRLKEEKENLAFEKMKEQAAIQIETEIESALDAHKTLPKSRHVVKRIADSMLWAMNNGFDDVSAEDVIPLVEKELKDELNQFYDDMPDEFLEKFLGNKTSERLRAKRISSMPQNVPNLNSIKPTASAAKAAAVASQAPREKIKSRDFFKGLGKKK